MSKYRVEDFAREIDPEVVESVRISSVAKVVGRSRALPTVFKDPEAARSRAAAIKESVLNGLKSYLLRLESRCTENGIRVHWAKDAESATRQIVAICQASAPKGAKIAKAKSMVTEEIHLNHHLELAGYVPVETDLGEFVIQIDNDTPSHIVAPISHKNRRQVGRSFAKLGMGEYTDDPEELTMRARKRLREDFRTAAIGISGVNFAVAETGRLVLVENEGNNRLSTTAPRVHIAVMGLEKVLPNESDLALFLPILACSATGQRVASYIHFISGPRKADEQDGPDEVHLVILDNGRSRVLAGDYRPILRCIRCGACQNICPVYRAASGHGYGHVYSGPLGAVLAPALEGVQVLGDLAKASTLCGACEEVCPVKIPIPRMLLQLRNEAAATGALTDPIPWSAYAAGASTPWAWKAGLSLLPMAAPMAGKVKDGYTEVHNAPQPDGVSFRRWWRERS